MIVTGTSLIQLLEVCLFICVFRFFFFFFFYMPIDIDGTNYGKTRKTQGMYIIKFTYNLINIYMNL